MIRKKIAGILAAIMVATTVLGAPGIAVKASTLNNVDDTTMVSIGTGVNTEDVNPEEIKVLENGTYEITNDAFRTDTTSDSGVREYIDTKSMVTVEDGKITVTMKYKDPNIILSTDYITINGVEVKFNENEDSSISFEVESIDTLYTRIVVGITYQNPYFGPHSVKFDLLHKGDLVKVENDDSEKPETSVVLEDGNYKIINNTYTVGTNEISTHTRPNVEDETLITVKDGKIYATMKYTDSGVNLIKETIVRINGTDVEVFINDDKTVTFEIPSIDTRSEIEIWVYKENIVDHRVKFDLVNDKETLEKVTDSNIWGNSSDDSGDTDNSGSSGSTGGVVDGTTGATQKPSEGTGSGSTGETELDKVYTAKNEIISTSEAGKTMARKSLSENMKIEKIGEKYRATITFTDFGLEQMDDIIVYVNGKEVKSNDIKTASSDLSFELESLDDSIEISAKISAMGGMRISFGLKVLQDTLEEVKSDDEDTTSGTTGGATGGTTGGTTQGGQTSGTTEDTEKEEKPQITVGKLYSIQNNVTHESETGVAMARKYLNATSKVEEIEGQYYVTLTFTGSDFMQNHVIYVNGSEVAVTRSTNGDETNIRFAVSSLTDDIKVKVYIVPMSREVEFGVELLVDTLTFIKEYTVETLPNTGAATSSVAIAGVGLILTSAGAVLTRKRK